MSAIAEFNLVELDAALDRSRRHETLEGEADRLRGSLRAFVRACWPVVWPNTRYVDGWHIDAICDHLEAVTDGEIRRLQVWVPPGTMKSTTVSILWPVWEWTKEPWLRYITASYDLKLATDFAVKSRDLLRSSWFRQRFPSVILKGDHDLKQSYANTEGGVRLVTSPTGGATGRHGDRIVIDDPLNAKEISSDAKLEEAIDWHDGTLSTRFADPRTSAEVIIMQRLHERDLAGHVLGNGDWTVLCLPERYEPAHPFVTPALRPLPSGRELEGDRRTVEGELLWPPRIAEAENEQRVRALGQHRAAGQLQQRPAAREGAILKRAHWSYYDPKLLERAEEGDVRGLPAFDRIVCSWDTTFKDKNTSDFVAGGCWGAKGGNRHLLRVFHERASLSRTKTAMLEMRQWAVDRWPNVAVTTLIENTANGPEIVAQLRNEVTGIIATRPSVAADQPSSKKTVRAEACEPEFESRNVYLPGAATADGSNYDAGRTPAFAQAVVEEAATFPLGEHDDLVDMTTQALNWLRGRGTTRSSLGGTTAIMPEPGSMVVR